MDFGRKILKHFLKHPQVMARRFMEKSLKSPKEVLKNIQKKSMVFGQNFLFLFFLIPRMPKK